MKTEVLFDHNKFYFKHVTQHACPYGYNTYHMVVISMSSLVKKETNNLGNMHNMNILEGYNTYHLFRLFLQFCEAFKQLDRSAFLQNVN